MNEESLMRGLADVAAGRVSRRDDYLDSADQEAYIRNAGSHLDALESTIHDVFTGKNDLFVKVCLLQDIEAVRTSLRAALQ